MELDRRPGAGAELDGAKLGTRTGKVIVHLPFARQPAVLRTPSNEGANLSRASFVGASLKSAELGAATLHSALLLRTDLRDADLRGVILNGARLIETELKGANLDSAAQVRRLSGVRA